MEAVLFDVGGTLLSINPEPRKIYAKVFGQMGLDISEEVLCKAIVRASHMMKDSCLAHYSGPRVSSPQVFNELLLDGCGLPCDLASVRDLSIRFANMIEFRPYQDAASVLGILSEKYKMAIVSNWNLDRPLDEVLEQSGILKYFDCTLASKDLGIEKPDKAIFEVALDEVGVCARESCYIGDSYNDDVYGALGAGLTPIYINRDGHPNPLGVHSAAGLTEALAVIDRMEKDFSVARDYIT